jgi:hypothetical protein
MRILVIVDQEINVDVSQLSNQLNEEVTLNSVSKDGISVFECGKTIPIEEWDWVGQVGTCNAPSDVPVEVEIPLEEDPIGNLITALSAVLEGMDTDTAIGESE